MTHPNDAIIREFIAAWERRDTDHIVNAFAEHGTYHAVPLAPIVGRSAIREFVAAFEGKPPGRLEIQHQLASDDVVLQQRVDHLTMNDRLVTLPIMGVFEMADGLITEWREYFDLGPVRAAYDMS